MAFSIQFLKLFHCLHLQAKLNAYDFIQTFRRLTDNMFAKDVSDPYPQFRRVFRIWKWITARRRLGQVHGIDNQLTHRPKGNLIIYCPACPEKNVNMEENWENTPESLYHLNQRVRTLDGNFHVGKYFKNTDEDDVSLFGGQSYIPEDGKYRQYLRSLPKSSADLDKATCPHLNALNKGDRKKFKNMEITGVIHVQCPHVFIQSSVDLQLGERFGNADYGLAHAIQLYPDGDVNCHGGGQGYITACNDFFSYDIACGYRTNIESRFMRSFPELLPAVEQARWLIPLVHVQNHKDDCIYLYSCSYNRHAGHQHGETCEQYWVESNQLGGQVMQMNNGNRQDTMIDNHSDWNYRKTASLPDALYNDFCEAKTLFTKHSEVFLALCHQYKELIPQWLEMRKRLERSSTSAKGGKKTVVESVYRHSARAVPSQAKIFQYLKDLASDQPRTTRAHRNTTSDCACFINEGINIEILQRKVMTRIAALEKDQSDSSLRKEIADRRAKLRKRIEVWWGQQKTMMPGIGDHVQNQRAKQAATKDDRPECKDLCLPSHFETNERHQLGLLELADIERQLREGLIYDTLRDIQNIVKILATLSNCKSKDAYGQALNTRANIKIYQAQAERDLNIIHYNATRTALVSLQRSGEEPFKFPPLTLEDTYRKSTHKKRAIGDSRKFDGLAHRLGPSTGVLRGVLNGSGNQEEGQWEAEDEPVISTQGTKARKRVTKAHSPAKKKRAKRNAAKDKSSKSAKRSPMTAEEEPGPSAQDTSSKSSGEQVTEDGWVWRMETLTGMTTKEVKEWAEEGNRVQWFRAEAEMERWQEQMEIKLAELKRCIATFDKMSSVWRSLGKCAERPGHAAYALRKADMYLRMGHYARTKAKDTGHGDWLIPDIMKPGILADHIQPYREQMYAPFASFYHADKQPTQSATSTD